MTLSRRTVNQYKLRLQRHLDSLIGSLSTAAITDIEKREPAYADEVHDRGEESSADAQSEINSAISMSHTMELARVRHALQRIRQGTYGICEDCGGSIGEARLNANPCARRCIECQSDFERIAS